MDKGDEMLDITVKSIMSGEYRVSPQLTIGEIIILLRRRMDISQSKLAELAHLSRNCISLIERGKDQNISLNTLYSIFSALECKIMITVKTLPNPVWLG